MRAMSDVAEELYELSRDLIEAMGYTLIDVAEVRAGGMRILRFYVDAERAITLDDCEAISRELSYLLDAEGGPEGSYALEVSSPGTDHELKKMREYAHFTGRRARLVLSEPGERGNVIIGTLLGAESDTLRVTSDDGEEVVIPLSNVARAHLIE
jgi:ribosome maturation factor RimP